MEAATSTTAERPKLKLLDSAEEVQAYLNAITSPSFPEAFRSPSQVTKLTTGIANGIHRLAYVNTTGSSLPETLILRHSTKYVFEISGRTVVWDLWPFELQALQHVPNTEFVKTPKVYWVDEVNRVILTEDAGPSSQTLKNLLLSDKIPNVDVFTKIGEELGSYLVRLHDWGRDTDVLKQYENKDARTIASWRTYGRLEGALAKSHPDLAESLKLKVKSFCETEQKRPFTANDTVIMGDFWTGNVLVNLDDAGMLKSLYIIDWEMIRPADAATEISQMLAEVWEGGEFGKSSDARDAARSLSFGLCSAYKLGVGALPANMLQDVMLAAGAHAVVWAEIGFANYGDEEKFKVVKDKAANFMWEAFGEKVEPQDWGFAPLSDNVR
ncbi:hypothetical protein TWF694_002915 [Orbilia ellipsospora]|uniref:Aminoglycoside phosphotransferase domain-containing protein n=1 Tax=Orbilia ellipsospora TaxID=2528407 RepID=A0AAV9X1F6_9PEZI